MSQSRGSAREEAPRRGGKRRGAGRKRIPEHQRATPAHSRRPPLPKQGAVHVTLRVGEDIPNLRKTRIVKCIRDCIQQAHTADFRIIHFSVMPDKLHLIVEADSRRALSRGMQGLKIRIARQVNPILKRKGTMFLERYRALIVKSPLDAKQALESVLKAFRFEYPRRRHPKGWIDPFSSAPFFGGWAGKTVTDRDKLGENVTTAATRPILRGLWKRFGLLQPDTPDEGTVFSPPGRTR